MSDLTKVRQSDWIFRYLTILANFQSNLSERIQLGRLDWRIFAVFVTPYVSGHMSVFSSKTLLMLVEYKLNSLPGHVQTYRTLKSGQLRPVLWSLFKHVIPLSEQVLVKFNSRSGIDLPSISWQSNRPGPAHAPARVSVSPAPVVGKSLFSHAVQHLLSTIRKRKQITNYNNNINNNTSNIDNYNDNNKYM